MQVSIWQKKKVTVFIGGDPEKGESPVITLEMDNPQIKFDANKNTMVVFESK